ncbi:hypothetical protein [Marivirga arenosa]|uniref:Uncharacterized protein n=1 Tax=Marivirga arenosa TaxID=3059076 RepID=A0AA51ZUS9_9BACT|nr:hypothetical protein [Marivirga sp. BKB1-2]WNB17008.1 hypothetical protein QYS47_32570 [Marivirga sp. BKB1-2]
MKIEHRITLNVDGQQREMLGSCGIRLDEGFQTFVVEETHKHWNEIKRMLIAWEASDVVETKFTKAEVRKSVSAVVYPKWINGFPQPEDDYLEQCYDLSDYCSSCGIGKVQKSPLRIKVEPKWGKKSIFLLNWIFEELFVKAELYDQLFKPLGVESEKVIIHKTGKVSSSVVQLILPTTSYSLDDMNYYPSQSCQLCGRVKYLPIAKGFFPTLVSKDPLPIFKTQEYFGSGAAADKRIIVGSELKDRLVENNCNVNFHPLG